MAVNLLTDDLSHRTDEDDDEDDKQTVVKREFVEENKQGKRKMYVEMMKDKSSQINNKKKKLSHSKSKHGTPHSAGKAKFVSVKLEKIQTNGICGSRQVKSPAMIRAENVQLSLGTDLPSCLKLLVKSNVERVFSLSLPASFCRSHLPMKDTVITLEDESDDKFEVKYFPKWMGLSAGWRNFAVQHKLRERDVLLFRLVEPTKFKVHIIRANDSTEVGVDPSLLNPDAHAKLNDRGENVDSANNEHTSIAALKTKKMKPLKSFSQPIMQKKNKRVLKHRIEQSENANEKVSLEFSGRSKSSDPTDPCKGLETLEDFQISINGLCIESELDENTLKKYYELCCCKNAILHDRVLSGLNSKLVGGIISETVNIADAIKACNFASSRAELEQWEKSLKSFKILGMNVGFLLNRLSQLLRLAFGSERVGVENEIKNLEIKRVELEKAIEKFGVDIEKLKSKAKRQQLKFQEVVNAPW